MDRSPRRAKVSAPATMALNGVNMAWVLPVIMAGSPFADGLDIDQNLHVDDRAAAAMVV
jgi:hypothetical protein